MPDPIADMQKFGQIYTGMIDAMTKQLDTMRKYGEAALGSGSGSLPSMMAKAQAHVVEGAEVNKKYAASVHGITASFKGMGEALLGPVGVVYGVYQAAKAFGALAESRLQLRNMSIDLGLSAKRVEEMQQTFDRLNRSQGETQQIMGNFFAQVKEMYAMREGSPLYKIFNEAGESKFAQDIMKNANDAGKVWDMVIRHLMEGGDRYRAYMAPRIGIPESVIDQWIKYSQQTKDSMQINIELAEKYDQKMKDLGVTLSNFKVIGQTIAIGTFTKLQEDAEKLQDIYRRALEKEHPGVPSEMGPAPPETPESKLPWWMPGGGLIPALPGNEMQKNWATDPNFMRNLHGGPEQMWPGYLKGAEQPGGAGGATFNERFGEWSKLEEDSNKSLRDIRDTLMRMEQGEGGGGGGGGGPGGIYSRGGIGRARRARGGGGAGSGGESEEGSTIPPSGNLAAQRAGFQKELENDPQLRNYAIDAMKHEGGIQSNMEQLFNYAAMRHMTIRQALHSGQYGPVQHGLISGNISEKTRQAGEAALQKVYAGSNITDYATDQGMEGDPNFAKYMSNPAYWHMHRVQGAWFSAHGEAGRRYYAEQKARDARARAAGEAEGDNRKEVQHPPSEVPHPSEVPDKSFQQRWDERISPKELTGKIRPQSFVGNMADQASLSPRSPDDYEALGGGYYMRRDQNAGMHPYAGWRQASRERLDDRRGEAGLKSFGGFVIGGPPPPFGLSHFRGGSGIVRPLTPMGAELGGATLDEQLSHRRWGTRHHDFSKVGPDGFVSAEDRSRFDKTQSNGGGAGGAVNHNLDVDVDFKNIPSWVKTGIAGGKFNRLKVTRSTAGGARSEEPVGSTDSNRWSY